MIVLPVINFYPFILMLNRSIAYILILALLSSNCSRFFVCAGFELNHKYVAENLCINKDRPWLHCNGHCYFMKKIKQAEENEKKQAEKDNLSRLEISFFQESFTFKFHEPVNLESTVNSFPRYTHYYTNRYIETIFRPPKTIM
jgi:hypothetical protein